MNDIQRDVMEVDVLFVGAGPATLAAALRLKQLEKEHNAKIEKGEIEGEKSALEILIIEKGSHPGALGLSGAVLDPIALNELLPDHLDAGFPLEARVISDEVVYYSHASRIKFPITPPFLKNHGAYIVSLSKVVTWLATQCEAAGIDIFPEIPGRHMLIEDGKVVGVRTGDKGVAHNGKPKSNFEPGADIRAKITVLGEGPRGSLTKTLIRDMKLDAGKNEQIYGVGVKEVWKVLPEKHRKGHVTHTVGYPLKADTYGGGFIYHMDDNKVSLGLVIGLDWADPYLDPQVMLQRWKRHPEIKTLLDGGTLLEYGAKALPEGGYFAVPKLYGDGFMLIGDTAGLLNARKLKGIHLAMKSGMLASEAAFSALLEGDASSTSLKRYENKIWGSWIYDQLYPGRNFRQCFYGNVFLGMFRAGFHMLFGGRGFSPRLFSHRDAKTYDRASMHDPANAKDKFDDTLTFSKLKDVYFSGSTHQEDQPAHLLIHDTNICETKCKEEYDNPCTRFCPADVYEMAEDPSKPHGVRMKLNFSNCVHCKTCDIKDPYEIIDWVTPEGGGGPKYSIL